MSFLYGDTVVYEYKGFKYMPEDDVEEDNVKRFHNVHVNNGRIYGGSVPLSPYATMTKELFERWIDMGRPTREEMGGHHPEHHQAYYEKWALEQLEKEFELDG